MPTSMKPVGIIKKFFGMKEGQTLAEFGKEIKELKQDEDAFHEVIELAAHELNVKIQN